jgi:hypothetical protein
MGGGERVMGDVLVAPMGGDATTVQGGIDVAEPGDTVKLTNGTYTENIDIDKELTLTSVTGTAGDVTITSSANGATINVNDDGAASAIVIQDITIKYTHTAASVRGCIKTQTAATEKFTVQRCIFESTAYGIYKPGAGTVVDRCKMTGTDADSNNVGIWATETITITACLFIDFYQYSLRLESVSGDASVAKNCTAITTDGSDTNATCYYLFSNGSSNGGPSLFNCIAYNGTGGDMGYGLRIDNHSDECIIKNCLVYDEDGYGTGTMQTKEIYRQNSSTTANNYVTNHVSGDTNGDATVVTPVFDDFDNADYHPNSDGSAHENGLASGAASYDLDGTAFDGSSPPIGCYAPASPASGWSAGTHCGPVAAGGIASVDGVAVDSISKIIGV